MKWSIKWSIVMYIWGILIIALAVSITVFALLINSENFLNYISSAVFLLLGFAFIINANKFSEIKKKEK